MTSRHERFLFWHRFWMWWCLAWAAGGVVWLVVTWGRSWWLRGAFLFSTFLMLLSAGLRQFHTNPRHQAYLEGQRRQEALRRFMEGNGH
jgi:hypothetical protein